MVCDEYEVRWTYLHKFRGIDQTAREVHIDGLLRFGKSAAAGLDDLVTQPVRQSDDIGVFQ